MKAIGIYCRVSTKDQSLASQLPDLERFVNGQANSVNWYRDHWTGRTTRRPGLDALLDDARAGKIGKVVVWRLDRLGRTALGLHQLLEEFKARNIDFVSLCDGLDLATAAGRLMFGVLASVACFESEVRAERVKAGQEAARAKGKTWGGSKPGRTWKVTPEKAEAVRELKASGQSVSQIARVTGLSRPTIYHVLRSGEDASGPKQQS